MNLIKNGKDENGIDEFQMFQIASETMEQPLKRNLSAAFVRILEKKTDATPEILDQLK